MIIIKGSSSDNQTLILQNIFKRYVEETAISSIFTSQAHSAELNQMGAFVVQESQSRHTDSINTLQQTALLAFNSMENDLSDLDDSGKNTQIFQYTIQEGDTLSFIASDFGVSMNTIIWANNIVNVHSLKPGDELKIPPINGVIHKVKKGDTIVSVAKKYSTEEEKIIDFNALPRNGALQIDDELVVPDGKIVAAMTRGTNNKTVTVRRFAYLPDLVDYFMLPTNGHNWRIVHGRNGVDIANHCGTPVYAAADGVAAIVDNTGWNEGFGKYIKIVHNNGTETLYAHNSKVLIHQNDQIEKGQQIALMGTTGRSTGCHLHFEVHGARNPLAKY